MSERAALAAARRVGLVREGSVRVVPIGTGFPSVPVAAGDATVPDEPYVLCVSTIEVRKNQDDELVRVPLIVYVPGQAPHVIDERASLLDVAPTVLDLAGVARPDTFRGRSLAPLVLGEALPAGTGHPPVVAEMLPCTAWAKNERAIVDTLHAHRIQERMTNVEVGP